MHGLFSSVPFLDHLFLRLSPCQQSHGSISNDQLNERNNQHEEANLYQVVAGFVPRAL